MTEPVPVLFNPAARAGHGSLQPDQVLEAISDLGATPVRIDAPTAEAAGEAVAEHVAQEASRLVVVGGDGLVHLAIQSIAESNTVLGLVPSGTGNDFARGLGLPTGLGDAVAAALGPASAIDLMRVGDRWAASVATAGFSVSVNSRANRMSFPRGSSRYTAATLLELPALHAVECRLEVDGEIHELLASVVTIANTSDFGGGMRITPDADPTDGILDLTIVGDVGRIELLRWFRKVFDGSHLDNKNVTTLRGRQISINAGGEQIWADGEPVADTPVDIEAVSGALQLAGS